MLINYTRSEAAVQQATGATHCSQTSAAIPGGVVSLVIAWLAVAILVIAWSVGIVVVAPSAQLISRSFPISITACIVDAVSMLVVSIHGVKITTN